MSESEFEPKYLSIEKNDGVAIVSFGESHLSDDQNIDLIGRELFVLVDQQNERAVILNLENVRYVSSSVLGKIITLHRKLHRNNGSLVVCGHQGDVADILRTSKLSEYFTTATDIPSAMEMLKPNS